MNIDINSLALVLSVANFMQVIALFAQWRHDKTYSGPGWWLLGIGTISLGFVALFLRSIPQLKLISIISNNVFFVCGQTLLYIGILRFFDRRVQRGPIIAFLDGLAATSLWTLGFIILFNQRLSAESREARDNLELIFSTNPDAVLITRMTDGYFVRINNGFSALFGYTRAEVLGKSTMDVNLWANPADRQKLVSTLNEKGFCENLEIVFQCKDQTQLIGMVSARIITLQGDQHIISVTRDITKRKLAEAELREASWRSRLAKCSWRICLNRSLC